MGRPHKNNTEELLVLLDDYFANEAAGNPDKLKFSMIAEYAAKKGISVQAYNLRRDDAVRKRVEELKSISMQADCSIGKVAYKSLDIDGLLQKNCSLPAIRKALMELDEYWKDIYEKMTVVQLENGNLYALRLQEKKKSESYQQEIARLQETISEERKKGKVLSDENKYLKSLVNKYLYPELANELLRQMNLPVKERKVITDQAVQDLIEIKRPLSYEGPQPGAEPARKRESKLIQMMKRQVDDS